MSTFDKLWDLAHAIDRVTQAQRELNKATEALLEKAGWERGSSMWVSPDGGGSLLPDARNSVLDMAGALGLLPEPEPTPKPEEQEVASE